MSGRLRTVALAGVAVVVGARLSARIASRGGGSDARG